MSVRRVRNYAAESGLVYQYTFQGTRRARRSLLARGMEYRFDVSSAPPSHFEVTIFVRRDALAAWQRKHGRALSSTEQYALAKMGLFRLFDGGGRTFVVDAANIEDLLGTLDIT